MNEFMVIDVAPCPTWKDAEKVLEISTGRKDLDRLQCDVMQLGATVEWKKLHWDFWT